jgi:TetR/AcrR family transcriptional repressor of nem operon
MGRISTSKERLLQAGRDLIWKRSYGAVTIDAICAEAGVRKGSFYYFFDSKADLVVASFMELWGIAKSRLDTMFSPEIPPLERIQNHFKFVYQRQLELKEKYGHAVGCPFSCLGSELSQQDETICAKAREVLSQYYGYIERALRDAQAEGSIKSSNLPATVQRLTAYIQGCLLQARVQNNVELVSDLWAGALEIIGAHPVAA